MPPARLSSGHAGVLDATLDMISRARRLQPEDSTYACEEAYQMSLLARYTDSMDRYREAAKLDEGNVSSLHGMIYCQLKQGQVSDAEQQHEFLSVIQESTSHTHHACIGCMDMWPHLIE